MKIGYFLSCEEFGPLGLLGQARMAEESGFEALWISDHYHLWSSQCTQSRVPNPTWRRGAGG